MRDVGAGDPLVFVHGVLTNGAIWSPVVDLLSREARCIAPDWPLGSHETPVDGELSPMRVAHMVDGLCESLGLGPVTLVGNDTGGAICQLVAAHHPQRVARLVLTSCDAYDQFPPRKLRPVFELLRHPMLLRTSLALLRVPGTTRLPIAYGWLAKHPMDRDLVRSFLEPARRSAGVRRDIVRLLNAVDSRDLLDADERLRTFDRPVLILWSREDRFFPPGLGERLARDLPNARLELVDDAYTFSMQDAPERVAASISAFLADQRIR